MRGICGAVVEPGPGGGIEAVHVIDGLPHVFRSGDEIGLGLPAAQDKDRVAEEPSAGQLAEYRGDAVFAVGIAAAYISAKENGAGDRRLGLRQIGDLDRPGKGIRSCQVETVFSRHRHRPVGHDIGVLPVDLQTGIGAGDGKGDVKGQNSRRQHQGGDPG